jgi:hypothetical protein
MKIKEIEEELSYGLASLVIWINCVRAPIAACQALINGGLSEEKKIHQACRVWVVGTLMGLILQIPVYGFLGVDWKKPEFYLPSAFFLLLAFIATVTVLHLGFRIYKIRSSFADTLVLYSIFVGAYTPLIQLLMLPNMYEVVTALKAIKAPGLGFPDAAEKFFVGLSTAQRGSSFIAIYNAIAVTCLIAFSQALLVVFQRCASVLYDVDRPRALAAMNFAMGFLFPLPFALLLCFYYFVLYAAL